MAASTASKVQALYSELNRAGQNGDYQRALNAANKILKESRNDETAFHCKVVCLIQLSQFQHAIKEIANNPALASGLMFEKAYCQYRLNRIQDALTTIKGVSNPSPKLKELKGQVLYRLEQYKECLDVYKDLIKNTSDDYDEERATNLSAVVAALQLWEQQSVADLGLKEDTFELSYNKACLLLGQAEYGQALEELDRAEELCKEGMEDEAEMTAEEIEAELGVIHVQRAYILQLQGRTDEAMKIYNQLVKSRPSDIGLMAVASNNIVSLNKDQNVFDSKKKIKATTVDGLQHKLTSSQQSAIAYNRCVLMLYTNQYDQCRKQLQQLRNSYPDSDMPCLVEAALLCREKQTAKAVQKVRDYIKSKRRVSLQVKLTLAQLYIMQGQVSEACEVLLKLEADTYKPGIVSSLVALYTNLDNPEGAMQVLDKAVEWYKREGEKQSELNTLLRENTNFKLKHGKSQAAVSMLEDLRKANPEDVRTLAQLISAYSKFDPKRAQELSRELPPVAAFSGSVDVDVLETTPLSLTSRQMKKTGGKVEKPEMAESKMDAQIAKKRRKHRKRHLPANYDPSVTPDPERWLPMRERSYFKGKRKTKKGAIGKGTQGATAGSSEMDASKPSSSTPSSPRAGSAASSAPTATTAASVAGPSPRQQKPGGQGAKKKQNKKKKGGQKW
ncbi:signal recognition particle subunit SRP72-like [Acanthaster planci]|uniref:Signal recognition particle subunit SRP72 n=1 Tax=Acanthaster planci TaxID=133434 RepID=A0A8B7YPS6_ACAPL|nr:signal recognition particle subunit SRP72-like [Acanthaster planci]